MENEIAPDSTEPPADRAALEAEKRDLHQKLGEAEIEALRISQRLRAVEKALKNV